MREREHLAQADRFICRMQEPYQSPTSRSLQVRFKKVTPPRSLCRCCEPWRLAFAPSRRHRLLIVDRQKQSGRRLRHHRAS